METVHADAIAAARAQELAANESFAMRRGVYARAGIETMRARAQAEADRITALPEVQAAMAAQAVDEGVAALPGMQEELSSRVQRAQQGAAHPRADTRTAEGRRRSSASAREGARVREQSERRAEARAASRASSSQALGLAAPSPNWPAGSHGRSDLFAAASVPQADFSAGASSSAAPLYMERPGGVTGEPVAAAPAAAVPAAAVPGVRQMAAVTRNIQAVASAGLGREPYDTAGTPRTSLSGALARAGQVARRAVRGRTPEPAVKWDNAFRPT